MKINYILNADNTIKTWWKIPFDENAPFIEVPEGTTIYSNADKVIDGKFVRDNEAIEALLAEKQAKLEKARRIAELKKLLADSDYICLKHADGEITDEEYAAVKAQRHAWRVEINELEA
jgi:hypothetical protein